jgi:RNA polymerase sigma factor (sigma-70 family)
MATVAIAHETIALTVAALPTQWGLSTYTETPAASPGLILFDLSASSDDVELYGRHLEELTLDKPKPSKRKEGSTRKIETRPRLKQDDKPVAGPRSAEPGPWLSEGLADCGMKQRAGKLTEAGTGYNNRLVVVRDSYRGVRHDGQHAIPSDGNSGFSLNDELFAEELAEEPDKDVELYDFEPQPKPKVKKTPNPRRDSDSDQKIAAYTPVSSAKLNSQYAAWIADPSMPNHSALWTAVFGYVQGQLEYSTKATKDRFAGNLTIEEEAQEFVLAFMDDLVGIEIRESFAACLSKSWENRKIANNRAFSKHRSRYAQEEREYNNDGDETWSKLDQFAENAWSAGEFVMENTCAYRDAVSDLVDQAIEEMPQPERSMFEDRQAGWTQKEIAEKHEVSPSAVSQRLKKAEQVLKEKVSK